jgi:hypothetical protein
MLSVKLSKKYMILVFLALLSAAGVVWYLSAHYAGLAFRDAKHCSNFGYCYSLSTSACVRCEKLNVDSLRNSRWRLVERMTESNSLMVDKNSRLELIFDQSKPVVSTACGESIAAHSVSLDQIGLSLPSMSHELVCAGGGASSAVNWPLVQFDAAANETILQLTNAQAVYLFEKVPGDRVDAEKMKTYIVLFKPEVAPTDIERFMTEHQLTPIHIYDMGLAFRGVAVNLSPNTRQAVGADSRVLLVEEDQEIRLDTPIPVPANGDERLR